MKVLLLGATGMLGSAVYKVLCNIHHYDITITARDYSKVQLLPTWHAMDGIGEWRDNPRTIDFDATKALEDYKVKGGTYFQNFVDKVGEVDYVINAIGVILPFAMKNPELTFFVNSALPHILARQYGPKLIHVTTDCVYAGNDGRAPYDELSPLSPNSFYGLSKSLGEPKECLTIRTSIAGPELSGHDSLLGWFMHEAETTKMVKGYTDWMWNGITTQEYGRICHKIMSSGRNLTGLVHAFSTPVSKYDTLMAFQDRFGTACSIVPIESGAPIDRTLSTIHDFNDWLAIPPFRQMIEEMV